MKTPWILVRYITNKNHSEIGVINAPTERYRGRGHYLVWITHRQKGWFGQIGKWPVTRWPVDRTESESPLCRKSMILPTNSRQKPLRTVGNLPSDLESLRFFVESMDSFMAYGYLDYAYVWWITSHAMSHIQLQGLSHAIPTLSTPCTCTSSVNHVRSVSETTWQCLSRWPGDHHSAQKSSASFGLSKHWVIPTCCPLTCYNVVTPPVMFVGL